MMMFDTPESINAYRLLALRSALRMDAERGMKITRGFSALKTAQEMGLTTKRNKMQALKDVDAYIVENLGSESHFDAEGNLIPMSQLLGNR